MGYFCQVIRIADTGTFESQDTVACCRGYYYDEMLPISKLSSGRC